MKIRITKRAIDSMAPGTRLSDATVTGFECRRSAAGRVSYLLYYRTADRRECRPKIGTWPEMTPDEARRIAQDWLTEVRKGGDPSAERQRRRKAATVGDLLDLYLQHHVIPHNKPSTRREIERLIRKRLKPELGTLKVEAVKRDDIRRLHYQLRETPTEANRVLATLSKAFSLACNDWELRPDHPCRGIRKYPERHRQRFFSEEELTRLGETLAAAELLGSPPPAAVAAIRLLALTGCRASEILNLRWVDVDIAHGALRLPDAKTGARPVPLGSAAIDLLQRLPRREGCPFVLTGKDPLRPLSLTTVEHAWAKLRAAARLEDARLHDLRHTVGTYSGQTGANAFMVRDLLGHKTLAMSARYVSRDVAPLRAIADAVSARIDSALSGNGTRTTEPALTARQS